MDADKLAEIERTLQKMATGDTSHGDRKYLLDLSGRLLAELKRLKEREAQRWARNDLLTGEA